MASLLSGMNQNGVFVRAANKGLAGYGTWKSIPRMGKDRSERANVGASVNRRGEEDIWLEGCAPVFL